MVEVDVRVDITMIVSQMRPDRYWRAMMAGFDLDFHTNGSNRDV